MSRPQRAVTFAANNGEIGGGEVMLLAMAEAARSAGWDTAVVGPDAPDGVLATAAAAGFDVTPLASDRRTYMKQLRLWDQTRTGLLWCNGLVPATATAGRPRRVVHLHRLPEGPQRVAATAARRAALATVVPSNFMTKSIRGAAVIPNWTKPVSVLRRPAPDLDVFRIGYIGRLGKDKGVHVLAAALEGQLRDGQSLQLSIAGEPRFVGGKAAEHVRGSLAMLGTHVSMLGWIPPADLLSQVDVLVVPSVWPEPFGLVAVEAMSARVPVIVSNAGALPEVVGADHPWIARRGDADDLARVLRIFCETPIEARQKAVNRAEQRWRDHFSPHAGEPRFLHLLALLDEGDQG